MPKSIIEEKAKEVQKHFKFTLPIIKTRTVKNGNEEERYIVGEASNTEIDLQKDRMSPTAIRSMADSLKQHVVKMNDDHNRGWSSELGDITKLEVTDDYRLMIESKLNKFSKANDLWIALTEDNKQLGLSIGGYVKESENEKSENGEWVTVYKDIELDHIAVTQSPANPKTWVNAIAKSLNKTIINEEVVMSKKTSLAAEDVVKDVTSAEPEDENTEKTIEAEVLVEEAKEAEAEEVVEEKVEEVVEEKAIEEKSVVEAVAKNTTVGYKLIESSLVVQDVIDYLNHENKDSTKLQSIMQELKSIAVNEFGGINPEQLKTMETEKSLSTAAPVVDVASYISYIVNYFKELGKDTTELERIVESLKGVAVKELQETEPKEEEEVEVVEDSVKEEPVDVEKDEKKEVVEPIVEEAPAEVVEEVEENPTEEVEEKSVEEDEATIEKAVASLIEITKKQVEAMKARDLELIELTNKISELEKQPAERKVAVVEKFEGNKASEDGKVRINGLTLEEALIKAEKDNPYEQNVFAMKQRIRKQYGQ